MGDLLLRGMDDALKIELQESARRNGRSLSDEAIVQIRSALEREQHRGQAAGQRLRAVLGDAKFDDDELHAIEAFRKQPDRSPPDFK
ncbi:plasmid stabilization protein [Rhizobium herbae]|uniref:Plasmid stability protein n=1 Tax=Rhizobium herbae TaxID=508661 RepID=A0ABS4EJF4_9HYPH|nr:plasmid stabilization protein [Rhizobium herbae]MBP1858072.1 plasmid stability protein [Rhizobium herbae]